MSSLRDFLHDSSQKCRLWSRTTTDLSLAEVLRDLAQDLKGKAGECRDGEGGDQSPPHASRGPENLRLERYSVGWTHT
jgi:hypothetical protein